MEKGVYKRVIGRALKACQRWFFDDSYAQNALAPLDDERRTDNRMPVETLARLALSEANYLVEIEDMSQGGCSLRLRHGLVPEEQREVQIMFPGEVVRKCKVRWTNGNLIGLEFDEPVAEITDLFQLEHLGENFFRALVRIQSRT